MNYMITFGRVLKIPVRHIVIYLGAKKNRMRLQLFPEESFTGFELIVLHEIDYKLLLDSEYAGEIILTILSDFKELDPVVISRFIIQQLRAKSDDIGELKKFLTQLIVLSRLRKLDNAIENTIEDMPIEIDLEGSVFFQKAWKKGIEKGHKEGHEIGHKKGLKEGRTNTLKFVVQKFIADGFTPEKIARILDMSLNEVLQLIGESNDSEEE